MYLYSNFAFRPNNKQKKAQPSRTLKGKSSGSSNLLEKQMDDALKPEIKQVKDKPKTGTMTTNEVARTDVDSPVSSKTNSVSKPSTTGNNPNPAKVKEVGRKVSGKKLGAVAGVLGGAAIVGAGAKYLYDRSKKETVSNNSFNYMDTADFGMWTNGSLLAAGALGGWSAGGISNMIRANNSMTTQEKLKRQQLGEQYNREFEDAMNATEPGFLGMKMIREDANPESRRFFRTHEKFMGNENALREKYENPYARPLGALAGAGVAGGLLYATTRRG